MQTLRETRPLYLVAAMQVAVLALISWERPLVAMLLAVVALALALVWGRACLSARARAGAPPR